MRRAVIVLLTAGLACSSGGGSGTTNYDSPQAVIDAMAAKSVACTDESVNQVNPAAKASATCSIGNGDATVTVFNSHSDIAAWKNAVTQVGGAFGHASGYNVIGSDWVVSVTAKADADAVQRAIGGAVESFSF